MFYFYYNYVFFTSFLFRALRILLNRNMYCLSYYSFLSKLKKRCERYDVELEIKNESYTSKTCTKCGNIKYNLGSNKIYNCSICKISIDRDINGSRNIMLKNNVW